MNADPINMFFIYFLFSVIRTDRNFFIVTFALEKYSLVWHITWKRCGYGYYQNYPKLKAGQSITELITVEQ